jgi:pyruvate dehydrogenase E2 component (dihydrolipoyllysine-residue acetyltransferase)
MTEIKMPRLSDSMQEGTILSWLHEEGEHVAEGDELVEIETDKATMAYESPAAGVLAIVAAVGETLPVGAVIATIGDGAAVRRSSAADAEAQPAAAAAAREQPIGDEGNGADPGRVRATPLARRLAREHGVDLSTIQGSGPGGRITRSDVESRAGVVTAVEPGPPTRADGQPQELTRVQQVVARRMSEAKATIPHFQVQTEARIDALMAVRGELKALGEQASPVPSLNDFIVKACALALRMHPRANGSYRDGRFELHTAINIGVAVAAPDALVVPTVTDADRRSVREIAVESRRLAERVRDARITPPELSGATFTISNLGMYGMTAITPVINPPQAAILGVGAARTVPALEDGKLVEHHLMTLTLSCDHRILYGADAARFLSDVREALEQPLRLLL